MTKRDKPTWEEIFLGKYLAPALSGLGTLVLLLGTRILAPWIGASPWVS